MLEEVGNATDRPDLMGLNQSVVRALAHRNGSAQYGGDCRYSLEETLSVLPVACHIAVFDRASSISTNTSTV